MSCFVLNLTVYYIVLEPINPPMNKKREFTGVYTSFSTCLSFGTEVTLTPLYEQHVEAFIDLGRTCIFNLI